GNRNARRLEPRRQRIERGAVSDLPAEEAGAVAHGAVDHDALLAVVHAEGEQRIAALHRLEAHHIGAELPPVLQRRRSEPGISQSCDHDASPWMSGVNPGGLWGRMLRRFLGTSTVPPLLTPRPAVVFT